MTYLHELLDALPVALAFVRDGEVAYANRAFKTLFRCEEGGQLANCPFELLQDFYLARRQGKPLEFVPITLEGQQRYFQIDVWPLSLEALTGDLLMVEDVTDRYWELARLELSRRVFDASLDGIIVTDADQRILMVNPAFTQITGYTEAEVKGKTPRILASGLQSPAFYRAMWQAVRDYGVWEGELYNRRKNGEIYPEKLRITAIKDGTGKVRYYLGIFSDMSQLHQAKQEVEELTFQDPLTGLPNRTFFIDYLGKRIEEAGEERTAFTVLLINPLRFRLINESEGHQMGDAVLREIAHRLHRIIGRAGTVARLAGDEFGVVLSSRYSEAEALQLAERIHEAFHFPLQVGDQNFFVEVSIGAARFDGQHITSQEKLLRCADLAMREAKRLPQGGVRRCRMEAVDAISNRFHLEHDLRHMVKTGEGLMLYYQPKVSLSDGRVVGAEALVRWQRQGEMIPPLEFIPVAEQTGLINQLGERVIEMACAMVKRLHQRGHGLKIAVNISPMQLMTAAFDEWLLNTVHAEAVTPQQLVLEVTESLLMGNLEQPLTRLHRLKQAGFDIAMDDFGTGFSSLSLLRTLPVDELKVDRSFIMHLPDDEESRTLVQAIVAMGHALGKIIVAEGIETDAQRQLLRTLGCEQGQGYLFSRPLSAEAFLDWLETQR